MTTDKKPSPRAALRLGTRSTHEALEAQPLMRRLMSDQVCFDDYRSLIFGFYRAYVPLCATLESSLRDFAHASISPLDLITFLEADVRAFGETVPDCWSVDQLPVLANGAQALGAWYVLEGSAQGGRLVAAHLRDHLGDTLPLSYLAGRNDYSPKRWRRFDAYFSQQLEAAVLEAHKQQVVTQMDAKLGAPLHEVEIGANAAYRLTARAINATEPP